MANSDFPTTIASVLSSAEESPGFLNAVISQLWPYINRVGCNIIKNIAEPVFHEVLPGPLSGLHFTQLDLGGTPISLRRVLVHDVENATLKLDADVEWHGECGIQLKSAVACLGVQKIDLVGRLSIIMKPLLNRLPVVSCMQVAFLEMPKLDLDLTGLADVADWAMFERSIKKKAVDAVLSEIAVLPNRLAVRVDPVTPWFDTYQQHLGFLRMTIERGEGFITPKQLIKDIPDVYCKVRLGGLPVWTTSTVDNSESPEWNESHDFLLSDRSQVIEIEALDDDLVHDDKLGFARINVGDLFANGNKASLPLVSGHVDTSAKIDVSCKMWQLAEDLSSLHAEEHNLPGLHSGLLTILIAGAKNLPFTREEAASSVQVQFGGKVFMSAVVTDIPEIDCLNPLFDAAFRVPLTSEIVSAHTEMVFSLMNNREKIASATVQLEDIIKAPSATLTETHTFGNGASLNTETSIRGIAETA